MSTYGLRRTLRNDDTFGLKRPSPLKTPQTKRTDAEYSPCTSPKRKRINNKLITTTPKTPSQDDLTEAILSPSPRKSPRKINPLEQKLSQCKKIVEALNESSTYSLVGRDAEIEFITNFISSHAVKGTGGSLYITGPPGTGKTACVMHCTQNCVLKSKVNKLSKLNSFIINCMTLKSSRDIYKRIIEELQLESHSSKSKMANSIKQYFCQRGRPVLIVLDEMDYLETKNQDVISNIFEWSSLPSSRLILIGLANALEPLDSTLPYLNSLPNCVTKKLQFYPYSKQQIRDIIEDRIQKFKEDAEAIFKSSVIEYCSRSAAAHNGDVRKALSMLSQATIDKMELASEQINYENGTPTKTKSLDIDGFEVKLKDIQQVLNCVNNSVSNVDGHQLPLQQKLIILSLMSQIKNGKTKEITIGKLHNIYSSVCRKQNLSSVDTSELVSLCSLLEDQGIFRLKRNKEARMTKVSLRINQMDLEPVLRQENHLFVMLDDQLSRR